VRGSTILEIPLQEQDWLRAELRHARRGGLLAIHILLLCAAGRTPTEIATCLFRSRTSVYRIVRASQPSWLAARCNQPLPSRDGGTPAVGRSLLALLKQVPDGEVCGSD
jgi:hypothetical protein